MNVALNKANEAREKAEIGNMVSEFICLNKDEMIDLVKANYDFNKVKRIDVVAAFSSGKGYLKRRTIYVSPQAGTIAKLLMLFSAKERICQINGVFARKNVTILVYAF